MVAILAGWLDVPLAIRTTSRRFFCFPLANKKLPHMCYAGPTYIKCLDSPQSRSIGIGHVHWLIAPPDAVSPKVKETVISVSPPLGFTMTSAIPLSGRRSLPINIEDSCMYMYCIFVASAGRPSESWDSRARRGSPKGLVSVASVQDNRTLEENTSYRDGTDQPTAPLQQLHADL